jgi:hypothetical protein
VNSATSFKSSLNIRQSGCCWREYLLASGRSGDRRAVSLEPACQRQRRTGDSGSYQRGRRRNPRRDAPQFPCRSVGFTLAPTLLLRKPILCCSGAGKPSIAVHLSCDRASATLATVRALIFAITSTPRRVRPAVVARCGTSTNAHFDAADFDRRGLIAAYRQQLSGIATSAY